MQEGIYLVIKSLYKVVHASLDMEGEVSESESISVEGIQGCISFSWLVAT